jgi:hypothetical protein
MNKLGIPGILDSWIAFNELRLLNGCDLHLYCASRETIIVFDCLQLGTRGRATVG